jgi:O-antigen ligase
VLDAAASVNGLTASPGARAGRIPRVLLQRLLPAFVGGALTLRVLLDRLSSPDSRDTASFGVSGAVAVAFGALALALLVRERPARRLTALVGGFLLAFTALALATRGVHAATLREGVREGSVLALAVVVVSVPKAFAPRTAVRLVQLTGLLPALEALHQLLAGTGMLVGDEIRANGTFAHPNSAAMFFALCALASTWSFLAGRGLLDVFAAGLYTLALLATYSVDGLAALLAMLLVLALLSGGRGRMERFAPCVLALLAAVAFAASPLGAQRIARESGSSLSAATPGSANSSLSWRFYKWRTLVHEWEGAPLLGRGLGTTTSEQESSSEPVKRALPHNEYVRYLVETGVVGLLLLAAGLLALLRHLWSARALADPEARRGAELALVVLAGCLANSLADNTLLNSPTCYAAVLLLAAGALARTGPLPALASTGEVLRP